MLMKELSKKLGMDMSNLVLKVSEKETEISEYTSESKKEQSSLSEKISIMDKCMQELKDFQRLELLYVYQRVATSTNLESSYIRNNTSNVLKLCDMEIMKFQEEINSLNASQDNINRSIELLIKKIANLNEDIRDIAELKKNIDLNNKIRDLSLEIGECEKKFNEYDLEALSKSLECLKEENRHISERVLSTFVATRIITDTLPKKKAMLTGETKQIASNIERTNVEYRDNYSDVGEQYSKHHVHYKVPRYHFCYPSAPNLTRLTGRGYYQQRLGKVPQGS